MTSASNRILMCLGVVCALTVGGSSWIAKMQGQEPVKSPIQAIVEAPIISDATVQGSTSSLKAIEELPSRNSNVETVQRALRPNYELPPFQIDDIIPGQPESTLRDNSDVPSVVESNPISELPAGQSPVVGSTGGTDGVGLPASSNPATNIPFLSVDPLSQTSSRNPIFAGPTNQLPSIEPPAASTNLPPQITAVTLGPISVSQPHVAGTPCPHCDSVTCTICCQPKCITRTILVPQWRTIWSSSFETRFRTDVKEEAYTIEREIEHQVPEVIQETVMVPEPRIRTYQEFRTEEFQVPVKEPYSVMVRKPKQRKVPVDREETFRVPYEEEYTVMVPQEKVLTETKYKTITEKEPREKKYTVEVEREKKRMVVDYEEVEFPLKKREQVTRRVKKQFQRKKIVYENVTKTRFVDEYYTEYVEAEERDIEKNLIVGKGERRVKEEIVTYADRTERYNQPKVEQVADKETIPQVYTVAVPYTEKAFEQYTVSEPYEEEVTFSWESRQQVPREVTRKYSVKIPYVENIPRQYKIKVPHQVMKKGKRTIPKQIPRTKHQIVKRDIGHWETQVYTVPTFEVTADRCGCSTCCPKTRTVRKTVWKPKVVASKIPYTVYETVKTEVEYEYPVLEYKYEIRDRMEAVTKYRVEPREVKLTVFDFEPTTESKTIKLTKYRQVPKRREVFIQRFREEKRERDVEVSSYKTRRTQQLLEVDVKEPKPDLEEKTEVYEVEKVVDTERTLKKLVPVERVRKREETYVVREPRVVMEPYTKVVEVKDFVDVTKMVKVQIPKPRIETYIEKVPEIRTRIEYVDVEKRVPYVETKTITETAAQTRSRTVYKTETRTVAELKTETYFVDETEVFERTVFKKKVRNVPVNRAEIYWVNVPKVLKKTVFKTVKRKIKRPALRRVPVRVPYQVEIRIPRQVCSMVPQTITIPVEECCETCVLHLPGVADAYQAYGEAGLQHSASFLWWIQQGAAQPMPAMLRSETFALPQSGPAIESPVQTPPSLPTRADDAARPTIEEIEMLPSR